MQVGLAAVPWKCIAGCLSGARDVKQCRRGSQAEWPQCELTRTILVLMDRCFSGTSFSFTQRDRGHSTALDTIMDNSLSCSRGVRHVWRSMISLRAIRSHSLHGMVLCSAAMWAGPKAMHVCCKVCDTAVLCESRALHWCKLSHHDLQQ